MRGRRQARRGDDTVHYRMRQRLMSIGDDFWIEDDDGERVYKVDGKALRLRKTLVIEDAQGHNLAKIQERKLHVKDAMEVEDAEGDRLAMIKKALVSPIRHRWTVEVTGGPDLELQGNIVDHEYAFTHGRDTVASVSKKWFRVRDTYGVEVASGADVPLVLAVTVAVPPAASVGYDLASSATIEMTAASDALRLLTTIRPGASSRCSVIVWAMTSLMPRITVKYSGRKISPTRYQDTMKIEMPQQITMLRSFSIANGPGLSTCACCGCGSACGSRRNFQMSTAQTRPGRPVR